MTTTWLALAVVLGCATTAAAHDIRGEVVFLDIGEHVVDVEIDVPTLPLANARNETVAELAGEPMATLATEAASLVSARGHTAPFALTVRGVTRKQLGGGDVLSYDLRFSAPEGSSARWFTFRDDLVLHRVVTANVFVFVRRDLQAGVLGESPTLLGQLHYQQRELQIDRTSGNWRTSLGAAFQLGLDHVREGTDHLMFLLMLLVVAPSVLRTARTATAFTLGHSLTLALGAVGGLALPVALVESLIALSILISAIHAVRPLFAGKEPLVAASFGLVHGLAFATALAGFGFDGRSLVLALAGFNLGVEAMQLGVILLVVPSLIALARTPVYPGFKRAVGGLGIVASSAWLFERAAHVRTPIPALVDRAARHGWILVIGLAALALISLAITQLKNLAPTEQRV